jgi:protein SCO1/2
MKTKLSLLLALLSLTPLRAETAACCSMDKTVAPVAASFSSRSIYQLDARWTSDANAPVALTSFRGQPVIVAMFFASCEYACPMLVADVRRAWELLPAAAQAKARIVLVSFDTERDTPAALQAYRARAGLDAHWSLLRGDANNVQELAMLLGVKFKRDARGQFAHSNLITVLNAEGEIVHQKAGLQGDVSEIARVVTASVR